jgi:hypothetical protein
LKAIPKRQKKTCTRNIGIEAVPKIVNVEKLCARYSRWSLVITLKGSGTARFNEAIGASVEVTIKPNGPGYTIISRQYMEDTTNIILTEESCIMQGDFGKTNGTAALPQECEGSLEVN